MKSEQEWREHSEWGKVFQAEGTASQEAQHPERSWCLEERKVVRAAECMKEEQQEVAWGRVQMKRAFILGTTGSSSRVWGVGKWHHHICVLDETNGVDEKRQDRRPPGGARDVHLF